jgi:hypothetical protein
MVLSFAATNIQLGLLFHAAVVITDLKLSAKLGTGDRAMALPLSLAPPGISCRSEERFP